MRGQNARRNSSGFSLARVARLQRRLHTPGLTERNCLVKPGLTLLRGILENGFELQASGRHGRSRPPQPAQEKRTSLRRKSALLDFQELKIMICCARAPASDAWGCALGSGRVTVTFLY